MALKHRHPRVNYSDPAYLKRRLGVHRRRLSYWSGRPSFTGFGPTGKSLQTGHMDEMYNLAADDAVSIASLLAKKGVNVKVVDVRATFKARYGRPDAPEILLFPESEE